MPSRKKARVREQMSKTGMSYEAALHSLRGDSFIKSGLACLVRTTHDGVYDGVKVGAALVENAAGMYIIGPEGENILYIQHAKTVHVPLAQYTGSARNIEAALEERVYAMLDSDAVHERWWPHGTERVPFEDACATLQRGLAAPLVHVLVNERDGERMRAHAPATVRIVASKLVPRELAYGTIDPRLTGGLVEHPDNEETRGRYALYLRAGTSSRLYLTP